MNLVFFNDVFTLVVFSGNYNLFVAFSFFFFFKLTNRCARLCKVRNLFEFGNTYEHLAIDTITCLMTMVQVLKNACIYVEM
jgi:hypothetical protein